MEYAATIRGYRPADLDDLYRICLLTAGSGEDGTALFRDPSLPGDIYAVPYAQLEPSLALVAEDAAGVAGYVVGALDSRVFARRMARDRLPALRVRYPEPPPEVSSALSVQERNAIQNIHHPRSADARITALYPSHLHINLLPRLQGRGVGRRLIAALAAELRGRGSPGVHLAVGRGNHRAVGFYQHVGFTELPSSTARVFGMSLQDPPP